MELSILEEKIKEIINICKSEERTNEKIANILLNCYEQGKQDGLKTALKCFL